MPRVICSLPNASNKINDVDFAPHESGGVISGDLSEDLAAQFLTISGYALEVVAPPPPPPAPPAPPAAPEKAAAAPKPKPQPKVKAPKPAKPTRR